MNDLTRYVSFKRDNFSWSVLKVDISVNRRRKILADMDQLFSNWLMWIVVEYSFGVSFSLQNMFADAKKKLMKNNKAKRNFKKNFFFFSRKKSSRKMYFAKQRTLNHIGQTEKEKRLTIGKVFLFRIAEEQSIIMQTEWEYSCCCCCGFEEFRFLRCGYERINMKLSFRHWKIHHQKGTFLFCLFIDNRLIEEQIKFSLEAKLLTKENRMNLFQTKVLWHCDNPSKTSWDGFTRNFTRR